MLITKLYLAFFYDILVMEDAVKQIIAGSILLETLKYIVCV